MVKEGTIFPLVGVKFIPQEVLNGLSIGEQLLLEHDTNNQFDKFAVDVKTLDGEHIGYIKSTLAGRFTNPAEGGVHQGIWLGLVKEFTYHEGARVGVRVQITDTPLTEADEVDAV